MRTIIQQYGRVILITVIFIMFFLWIPFLVKRLDRSGDVHTRESVDNLTTEVTFYVDGVEYVTEKGMSWEQWVVSDYNRRDNGTRIFTIWDDPCNDIHKVGSVTLTSIK